MPLILPGNVGSATAATGFTVANSCRFNIASSDNLSRTPSSGSNRKTFTISMWVKGTTTTTQTLMSAGETSGAYNFNVQWAASKLSIIGNADSSSIMDLKTTALYRDFSAWYHFVLAFDTTQSTAANRVKVYVNGVQETSFSTETYPARNTNIQINNNTPHSFGMSASNNQFWGGYMAELILIDGSALAPTSFGEFDEDSGIWKPIDVSELTFGTNGFYLEFKQAGTGTNASGMGADTSGNTNHFAVNNLTAVDQSTDTCTNNFCTLNPLQIGPRNNQADSAGTFSEGNLNVLMTGSGDDFAGTIAVSTGKWFYEVKLLSAANHGAGFTLLTDFTDTTATASNAGIVNKDFQYGSAEGGSGSKIANNGNTDVAPQNNFDDNDIIGFAFDIDGGTLKIYNNGSLDRTISSIPAGTYIPIGGDDSSTDANLAFNFGSPAYAISSGNADGNGYGNFEFAVPSGYFALCTKNLAEYG